MDIPGWLRNLGLEKYEAAFRDNEINEKVLPKLTAEDLKDIGIGIVGHRRVLLDAIAALRAELNGKAAPAASASTPPSTPMASATLYPDAAGERRYLTVMFCDLVDSTGISARIDAEEWRDLVGSYLDAASVAVTEMGGQVAKKLGDRLLTLFGYPIAQENDAERAVRAALAIQRALTELNRKNAGMDKPELAARIGIETGPAVVDASWQARAFSPLYWRLKIYTGLIRRLSSYCAESLSALAPLLVVATTRPEFRPAWGMRSHHATISLAPLDRAQVRDMVAELSARHALPKEVVEDVAARTGGVPLFVEEVTRLLLESGEQGGIHAIPPTLQQSLMARLDRLGPAREVAQIGAVIGRGFSYGLLRAAARHGRCTAASGAGNACRCRHCSGPGLATRERLSVQARAHPGRGLREPAQKSAPSIAPPCRRNFARPLCRDRRGRAGSAGASLHAGGHDRCRNRMVGQGRRPGAAPLRFPGGDLPSRQGHRDGRQGRQRHAA